jgi:anti-sigma factor RsiW
MLHHDRATRLLPWLVNGSLEAPERRNVELHVRTCIACRRELKELERLATAVQGQPLMHLSTESGLRRLEEQLDVEPRRERVGKDRTFTPMLRYALAAGLGTVFLGALLWLAPGSQNGASYSTLATSPAEQKAEIDLIFAEQTPAADVQALLQSIDGEIVAGPSALGRYGIRIRGSRPSDGQLTALIERLGHDPRVRFAGRSFTENTP